MTIDFSGQFNWPLPSNINIAMTTRHGGVSLPPFQSLNLGTHVGDNLADVLSNRAKLSAELQLPSEPVWLEQVHGIDVVQLPEQQLIDSNHDQNLKADASYTATADVVCAIMTADCLPILLCDEQGREVAAVHAGWRSLCAGIIEATLQRFQAPRTQICAYLGPAIGATAFEVGREVKQAFTDIAAEDAQCFLPAGDKFFADLQQLAIARLTRSNLHHIYTADACTYSNSKDFFSYRRDGTTGRMASLIWINA